MVVLIGEFLGKVSAGQFCLDLVGDQTVDEGPRGVLDPDVSAVKPYIVRALRSS